jgi:hypothetical protein
MPQVILFAAIGAGLYAGYRAIARAGEALAAEMKRNEEEQRQRATANTSSSEKDLGTLEFDPRSGVYKPVRQKS